MGEGLYQKTQNYIISKGTNRNQGSVINVNYDIN